MIALLDSDNIAFACAASANDTDERIAVARTKEMVESILFLTRATSYELWLSGSNNFRYRVYPEYKANRADSVRPIHEKACRQYLIEDWKANIAEGLEADDMLGIRQHELDGNSILCHLDKDLNQITGKHFNWELKRL